MKNTWFKPSWSLGIDILSLALFGYSLAQISVDPLIPIQVQNWWVGLLLLSQLVFFSVLVLLLSHSPSLRALSAKTSVELGRLNSTRYLKFLKAGLWLGVGMVVFFQTLFHATLILVHMGIGSDTFSPLSLTINVLLLLGSCLAVAGVVLKKNIIQTQPLLSCVLYGWSAILFPLLSLLIFFLSLHSLRLKKPLPPTQTHRLISLAHVGISFLVLNLLSLEVVIRSTAVSFTVWEAVWRIVCIYLLWYLPYKFLLWYAEQETSKWPLIWAGIYGLVQLILIYTLA